MSMKVGIVITTYNGSAYIIEELQSILGQSVRPDEVLISDDNSSDNTCQLILDFISENKLTDWYLIRNKKNKGFSVNFMETLYLSSCDYIFLADQDDVWEPNKIEMMIKQVNCDTNLTAIASQFTFIDSSGNSMLAPKKVPNTKCDLNKSLELIAPIDNIISSYIRGCTMMIHSDVVKYIHVNNLHEMCSNNLLGHDWLLWAIASLMGNAYILHEPLIKYRFHESNTSLSALRRKSLVGCLDDRIDGLKKSISIHEYIINNKENFEKYSKNFEITCCKAIKFEKTRLIFLSSDKLKIAYFLELFFNLSLYKRYYRNFLRGIKVFIGDFIYHNRNNKD